jgi:hypothetical protein
VKVGRSAINASVMTSIAQETMILTRFAVEGRYSSSHTIFDVKPPPDENFCHLTRFRTLRLFISQDSLQIPIFIIIPKWNSQRRVQKPLDISNAILEDQRAVLLARLGGRIPVWKPWVISSSRTASPRPVHSLQITASYSYFRLVSL